MMEARMPPGFRFHPRDDELVLDYLLHRLSGRAHGGAAIVDVDLNKCEPWDLPGLYINITTSCSSKNPSKSKSSHHPSIQ
jgi:hypothetical protein